MRKLLFIPFFFLLLVIPVKAVTNISTCTALTTAGETYYLTADIINSSASTCMNIQASNIVLDCQGHTIDGIDADSTYGIKFTTGSGSVVRNCIITDWYYGIYFRYATTYTYSNLITNTTLSSNTAYGIAMYYTYSNTIENSSIISSKGIYIYGDTTYGDSYNNIINNVTMSDCSLGISINQKAYETTIKKTKIHCSQSLYFYETTTYGNTIYNNLFNSTTYVSGTTYTTVWNTTKQTGERVYSPGNYIGGNYWTNSTGNGYSDTCTDSGKDGFCDSSYTIPGAGTAGGDKVDYLPLSDEYESVTYLYNCGVTLSSGKKYVLMNDVNTSDTRCWLVPSDVVLDLNGHTVTVNGDTTYSSQTGIQIDWDASNVVIKNGTIRNINSGAGTDKTRTAISGGGVQNVTINSLIMYVEGYASSNYGVYFTGSSTRSSTAVNISNSLIQAVSTGASTTTIGVYFGLYYNGVSNSSITTTKISTSGTGAYDLYFSSGSNYNYVCAEFDTTKVYDVGTGNSINYCPYTPPPTCNCTDWMAENCVSGTQRKYTRICTPSGCDVEVKYETDTSCTAPTEYPWLSLLNSILSPFWLIMLITFGMSAGIEKKLNSGGIAFIVSFIIFSIIFSVLTRQMPFWIPVIVIILIVGFIVLRGTR